MIRLLASSITVTTLSSGQCPSRSSWIASARRTASKSPVGFSIKQPVPTLKEFAEADFLPFVRSTSKEKPNTVRFYENCVQNLKKYPKLSNLPLDAIAADIVAGYIAHRQERRDKKPLKVSTINRDLATLRRMLRLAQE